MEITKKKMALGGVGLLLVSIGVGVAVYMRSGSSLKGDLNNPPGAIAAISSDQTSYDLANHPTMTVTFSVPDSALNGTIYLKSEADPSQVVHMFDFIVGDDKTVKISDPLALNQTTTPSGPHTFGYLLPKKYDSQTPLITGTPANFILSLEYQTNVQALIPPTFAPTIEISNSALFPKLSADPTNITLDKNTPPLTITFGLPEVAVEGSIDLTSPVDPNKKVKTFLLKQVDGIPHLSADEDAQIVLTDNNNSTYSFQYTIPKKYPNDTDLETGVYPLTMSYQTSVPALIPPVVGPNINITVPQLVPQIPDSVPTINATPKTVDLANSPKVTTTFHLPNVAESGSIDLYATPDNGPTKILKTFPLSYTNQVAAFTDNADAGIALTKNNDGTYSFTYNIPSTFPDGVDVTPEDYMMSLTYMANGVQSSPVHLDNPITFIEVNPDQNANTLPMINGKPNTVNIGNPGAKVNITFGLPQGASGGSINFYHVPDNDVMKMLKKFYLNFDNNQISVSVDNGNTTLPLTNNNNGTYSFDYKIPTKMDDGTSVPAGKYILSVSYYTGAGSFGPHYSGFITFVNQPANPQPSPSNPPPSPPASSNPPSSSNPPLTQTPPPTPSPVVTTHGAADAKLCGGFSDASIFSTKVCALAKLMQEKGIFTSSAFRQTQLVKRYEAALAVVRAFKLSATCVPSVLSVFPDVDEKASYFDQLCTANSVGVIKGYQNNPQAPMLLPTKTVTAREFSRMISNAYIIAHIGKSPRSYAQVAQALNFEVNPFNGWFGFAFQFLVNEKVMTVEEYKSMDLDKGMTRLEVAQMLEKVLNDLAKK